MFHCVGQELSSILVHLVEERVNNCSLLNKCNYVIDIIFIC
jgi:hypothetical protein